MGMNEPIIHIKNMKRYRGAGTYVGRPSVLGNPFEIGRDGGRDEVIQKYRTWLEERLESDNATSQAFVALFDEMCAGKELILICFCAPKKCHAEVIREFLLQAWEEKQRKEDYHQGQSR